MAVRPVNLDAAIAAFLRANGMTQNDLAAKIGISPASLSAKRRGARDFSFEEVIVLCDLLGASIDKMAPSAEEVRASKSAKGRHAEGR